MFPKIVNYYFDSTGATANYLFLLCLFMLLSHACATLKVSGGIYRLEMATLIFTPLILNGFEVKGIPR